MPKGGQKRIRTGEESFSETEWKKMLAVVDNQQDRVMLMIGISLGLRRMDMVRLRIEKIDLERREITYHQHKKDKTDKETQEVIEDWRTLPISDGLVQEIRIYLNTLAEGGKIPAMGWLFPYGASEWGDRQLYNRLKTICEKAGVRPRKFHALRATAYKAMQKAGWPALHAAEVLGDTLDVAEMHYGTPSKDDLRELVDKKDVLAGKQGG